MTISKAYLIWKRPITNTWWLCNINISPVLDNEVVNINLEPCIGGIAKELTNDELNMCNGKEWIKYNGKDIVIADKKTWDGSYVQLVKEITPNVWTFGITSGTYIVETDNPSKSGDKIWVEPIIGKEAVECFQAKTHNVYYDLINKKLITEKKNIPVHNEAKPLYENTLATYGSGYLWNKLTKTQQKELTTYLDALDTIINETSTATELPNKPDFIK